MIQNLLSSLLEALVGVTMPDAGEETAGINNAPAGINNAPVLNKSKSKTT